MSGLDCDVCGSSDFAGIACSPFGPVSFSYCKICATNGYEPWGTLVTAIDGRTPLKEYEPWFQEMIDRNLKFHNKTWEDLQQEAQDCWDDYFQAMSKEPLLCETCGQAYYKAEEYER